MIGAGLGPSQQAILLNLKRHGVASIPRLAEAVGLNVETVRGHLRSLESAGLAHRSGTRRSGPGRPEILYGLTDEAQSLFPDRQGELLRDFAAYVQEKGQPELVEGFFQQNVIRRRAAAMERVAGLVGKERLEEVARILSEQGFMAEIEHDDHDAPVLRLNHCPLRELVRTTTTPCRSELSFVRELLGEGLARVSYIPAGDAACCYAVE